MTPVSYPDRRKKDRIQSIFTFLRLAVELIAIVWAVAGLNNATSSLRDVVLDLKKEVNINRDHIAMLQIDVSVIQSRLLQRSSNK